MCIKCEALQKIDEALTGLTTEEQRQVLLFLVTEAVESPKPVLEAFQDAAFLGLDRARLCDAA